MTATKALIRYVYEEFDVNRGNSNVDAQSEKQAIPERLGFTQEGVLRDSERLRGALSDMCIVY